MGQVTPTADLDGVGAGGDRSQDGPDERRMALRLDPGVEVVGDRDEVEARVLGPAGMVDEGAGCVLLTRQRVAELRHAGGVPARTPEKTCPETRARVRGLAASPRGQGPGMGAADALEGEGVARDATTLAEVVDAYVRDGFAEGFRAAPGARVTCLSCRSMLQAATLRPVSMRRLEGASDPADMLAVAASCARSARHGERSCWGSARMRPPRTVTCCPRSSPSRTRDLTAHRATRPRTAT